MVWSKIKHLVGNGNLKTTIITLLFGALCVAGTMLWNFSMEHYLIKMALNSAHAKEFEPIKSCDLQNQINMLGGEISEAQDLQRMNEAAWKDMRSDLDAVKSNVQFIVDWIKPEVKK